MSWAQAFDDRADTHWFSRDGQFLSGRTDAHVWLEYCLPAQQGTVALARYTLTAASGSPSRDPWTLCCMGYAPRMCAHQLSSHLCCMIAAASIFPRLDPLDFVLYGVGTPQL